MKNLFLKMTKMQKRFMLQILFATSFTTLTSGAFLSGLAIYMGASDVLVSYISVITNVCGVFVLMFASFLDRVHYQKRLTIGLTILAKITTLSIVLVPLYVKKNLQLYVFGGLVLAAFTLQGLSNIALNNWLAFYTPNEERGQYISVRQTLSLMTGIIFSILAGRYLDLATNQYVGFAILFLIAFIMASSEILVLLRLDDTCIVSSLTKKYKIKDILVTSVKNKTFISYVLLVLFFYLFLYIGDSFTFIFMFRYLKLPYTTITLLQMMITLPQIVLLGLWGKISDKKGHKWVLNRSIWFFAGETFFLFLTSTSNWGLTIPLAFLISSVANSGFVLAVFNRRYEIIPENGRMLYDSFFNAVIGIAFILGPFLGGLSRQFVLSHRRLMNIMEFSEIRLLYMLSTLGIVTLQIIYLVLEKTGKSSFSKINKGGD